MTQFLPVSLSLPGGFFSDKGKAKEVLHGVLPPPWYPGATEDEEHKLEGNWWSVMGKDEAYVGGLPTAPIMAPFSPPRKKRIPSRRRKTSLPNGNAAHTPNGDGPPVPELLPPKPISLENAIHRSVDKLGEARRMINQIQEFQRIEAEGGVLPPVDYGDAAIEREREEGAKRKRQRQVEYAKVVKRRKRGGEVGETEAVLIVKRATASMLAHAGFEGES
jgi:transcriptional activator SPT7